MPYLRTEWGVLWPDGQVRVFKSDFLAREFAENWNSFYSSLTWEQCKVVQRSISDWGTED